MPQLDSQSVDVVARSHRSRRRIAILAFVCLIFVISIAFVWSIDRPLNDVEKRLLGTWRNSTSPSVFTFHSDRTVTSPGYPRGVWHVRESTLYTADTGLMGALETLLHKGDPPCELTFEDDDNISVIANGGTHKWQRVSNQQASGTGE